MTTAEERLRLLMERGLDGDAAAHRQLLSELTIYLRAFYARRLGRDALDLEDLVQETLIGIHSRRESYDPGRPFMTWAFSIARYKMIDHLRKRGLRATEPIEAAHELFAEDDTEWVTARADLDRLMANLPPKQRDAIRYVKIEGLSVAEAAQRSGLSAANVKISVHRGLSRLRSLALGRKTDADG